VSEPALSARHAHLERFDCDPELIATAPGRVNLIGEHTDYNDGFVLPVAINYHTAVAISRRDDRRIVASALDEGTDTSFDLDSEIAFDSTNPWSNYLRGVVVELLSSGYRLAGANLTISGNVPMGAGLSSSAALEIALIRSLTELSGETITGQDAARIGQAAENNFVGCNCGIMDQLISAQGLQDHALLIDCRSLDTQPVPLPADLALVIINSNVHRQLVDGEYNLRRQQCEEVAAHFSANALRDVDLQQLTAAADQLTDVQFRRARHVITENERTLQTVTALRDADLSRVGELMHQSHESMRRDFEITVPEIDTLVDIARSVTGRSGGVRMTGGGFGGCVIALVPQSQVAKLVATVTTQYPIQTGLQPTIFQCSIVSGAFNEVTEQ
jgi:galactokinase